MQTRAIFLVMGALVAATMYIVVSVGQLPPRVATHFGPGGAPDGWMSRDSYLLVSLAFLYVLPLLQVFLVGLLPRRFPATLNIPGRDYWLEPERRAETFQFLFKHACSLAILCALFVAVMHHALVVANRATPPELPMRLFLTVLGAFALLVIAWALVLYRHFRRPRGD